MSELLSSLMTPEEVIKAYGTKIGVKSTKTLWQLRHEGKLGYFRSGKRVLHSVTHIEEYLMNYCERPASGRSAPKTNVRRGE